MIRFIAVIVFAIFTADLQAKELPLAIDYQVRRLPSADRYEITLRFTGEHSGRSTLTIPQDWADATHAECGIEGLAVVTRGARLEDTDAPWTKRIVHHPDAPLTVRYVLKQIATGPPSATAPTQFLPVIQPTYFEWIGWTTWIVPVDDNRRRVRIRLAFHGLPDDWAFASSYGLDAASVVFDGPVNRFQAALPYARGMLLAARWDFVIRAASHGDHSLDNVMRTLREEHRRGVEVLDAARIVAVVQSHGVRDAQVDLDVQIDRGELPRLADDFLTPCISIVDATAPRDDIGFDLTKSIAGGTIVGVDPDGPAFAAGLRDGPDLRSFRTIDRAEQLVEAGFQGSRHGEIRTIRYRTLGRDLTRQHIKVRDGLDEASLRRCLRTLVTP